MITKKLGKITWAFEPSALNGKGYWFVYGKNGALGRAATKEEYRQLGVPSDDEIYPKKDAEKEKSEEPEESMDEMTDEERQERLQQDALRRNRRARYYGKLTQTSSQYETANIVRGKTYGQIVSERMLRGEGGASAFKGALGEKIGAVGTGIKEKFDPMRLLNKVPIVGSALATMYGMKRGRSAADISYFTGAGRFLPQQPKPGQLGGIRDEDDGTGLASKVTTSVSEKISSATKLGKDSSASGVAPKNINNVKTTLGAIKKLYSLEQKWYEYDKKYRDEEKREKQIAKNFIEEKEMERHNELIKALTGKDSKIKKTDKPKKEESKGFFGGLFDLFKNFLGIKLLDGLFSVMRMGVMGLLRGAVTLLAPVLAPLLSVLGPMIAVIAGIVAVTKGLDWLISKFTGKNADYFKMKADEETTPEDVKKIIKDPNRFRDAQSEKQYEINKKIVETGKGAFGIKLGEKEIERAKKGVEDYEKLKSFKESDDPLMSYKRDIKEGKIDGMTSYEEYKNMKSNVSTSGVGDKSLMIGGKPLPRNLRNNNPGNVRYEPGGFAEKFGATGADSAGFAIFPTMEAGEKAQKYLLFESESKDKSRSYKNLTVDKAVEKYAPPSENDTAKYQKYLRDKLGSSYDPNKKLSEYSDDDKQKIATAIQKFEGGTVEEYKLAQAKKSQTATKVADASKIKAQEGTLTESYQANVKGVTQEQVESHPNYKKYLAEGKKLGDTDDEAAEYAENLVYNDMAKSASNKSASKLKPVTQPDPLSSRMTSAVSENKNLQEQKSNIPPIMVTNNNVMNNKGGGQSVAMGPTPVRNDEPMLLRSQYGVVKPV